MFTGLIQEIGIVKKTTRNREGLSIEIQSSTLLDEMKVGDSIAIDGACQSVVKFDSKSFTVQAVSETVERTTFRYFKPGTKVNLESPMAAGDRFHGHFVQGHIDGVAQVVNWTHEGDSSRLTLKIPENLSVYLVEKGSVTVNGVSLTIAAKNRNLIDLALIPITLNDTNLGLKKPSDYINIEVDILAKYIENFMNEKKQVLLSDRMKEWGNY